MEALTGLLIGAQFVFTIIASMYFFTNLKKQNTPKKTTKLDSKKEIDKMRALRVIKLTEPLSEKTRPKKMEEIIGQEKGLRALRAALCGPNPQHVIIYGSPGIGKTAAARIVLDEAGKFKNSPFAKNAPFIEMDATTLQFDERSIADPLIGSVHDPIYQGAGAYGNAGVPCPKAGAVTKAHGGVLFIDEIGELHPLQMNKLLKTLEDRKVFLTSSYYSEENTEIPKHIHDIFTNGFPADFRLIGATTRSPEDIPSALRSRCTEIFFRRLNDKEVIAIAENAFKKTSFEYEDGIPEYISKFSSNGRDTVNIVQTSISIAMLENRNYVKIKDVEDVIEYGRYSPKPNKKVNDISKIGVANGLAVYGGDSGALLEIEAVAEYCRDNKPGLLKVTGIVEQEEISNGSTKMKRSSTAKNSVENAITVLNKIIGIQTSHYNLHVNFPGGSPIDGPSAGIAIFTALYSALLEKNIYPKIAMTGEITIKGRVNAVGGVPSKIEAAIEAGVEKVIIPKSNYQKSFKNYDIEIITAETISDIINEIFGTDIINAKENISPENPEQNILTASSL